MFNIPIRYPIINKEIDFAIKGAKGLIGGLNEKGELRRLECCVFFPRGTTWIQANRLQSM